MANMRAEYMSEMKVTGAVKLSQGAKAELQRQKRATRINNEKYFRIHPELRQMTSAFISALLADKPDDVHLYAEQFFTNPELAHSLGLTGWSRPASVAEEFVPDEEVDEFGEDELNPEVGGATEMDAVDLENLLISLFKEADADGSGSLDAAEFANLMATADLGLSKNEVKMLLAEADENMDGGISYQEFVPLAVETVQTMRLKQRYAEVEADMNEELTWAAAQIIGMDRDDFAAFVRSAGEKLGSGGMYSKAQLKALLKSPTLGLSKQQATAAAADVAFDASGNVAVSALEETLYDTVLKVVADALAMQNVGVVGDMINEGFRHYDKEDTGYIDKKVARSQLLNIFPFLTKLQATAVLNDAPLSEDGSQLAWKDFLPKLTALVKAMGDPEAIRERSEMALRAEFAPMEMMSHLDKQKFEESITMLFAEADKDGNGVLDVHEMSRLLDNPSIGLRPNDAMDLMDMYDDDQDALISLEEFKNIAYEKLAAITRERAIMDSMDLAGL